MSDEIARKENPLLKVSLWNYTPSLRMKQILVASKHQRLTSSSESALDIVSTWDEEKIDSEIEYISNTIPTAWELVDYTFEIKNVSIACARQYMRNRNGVYQQQSLRVADGTELEYIYTDRNLEDQDTLAWIQDRDDPDSPLIRVTKDNYKEYSKDPKRFMPVSENAVKIIEEYVRHGRDVYKNLIDIGQPAEDARGILHLNTSTNLISKFNLRTISDLAKSRTGGRTQIELQRVINSMIDQILEVHPWVKSFLFKEDRDFYKELEDFAHNEWPNDLIKKGRLLKIIDQMKKSK